MPSTLTQSAQSARSSAHVVTKANRTLLPSTKLTSAAPGEHARVRVRLAAAVLSAVNYEPMVRVLPLPQTGPQNLPQSATPTREAAQDCLPSGDFGQTGESSGESSLDRAVRASVTSSTGLTLGYLNQLATFAGQAADRADDDGSGRPDNDADLGAGSGQCLTVGYLALVHTDTMPVGLAHQTAKARPGWVSCYTYLPWEDWRNGRPSMISSSILPRLTAWADRAGPDATQAEDRRRQIQICFGNTHAWDDERVLERYELMQAAGLFSTLATPACAADGRARDENLGRPMAGDHRRILAAALGRLRSKLRYRPVIFELMAHDFTLFELQRTVEGIIGPHLHKQNFRRLVESMGLVEATGAIKTHTGGRPAKLFRFRPGVVLEQAAPGMRVRLGHV